MSRWLIAILLLLTACAPTEPQNAAPLPTLFPTATLEFGDPAESERVAREFLHDWQERDYAAMYQHISYASQQATTFENFQAIYENAHAEMRLDSLETQIIAEYQRSHRVTEYIYDAAFTSSLIGEFSDRGRSLLLVKDEVDESWRVAWSAGNIFAEMGNGALLRLQAFPPRRANIYDFDGDILADMNGVIVTVDVVPGRIPDRDACLLSLTDALDQPQAVIQARLATFGVEQRGEIGTMDESAYRQWQGQLERDCDAQFGSRAARRYISGSLMPHVVGYVGYPDEVEIPAVEAAGFRRDSIIGRSGIEASWDETLRGTPGGELQLVTPGGERVRLLAESAPEPAQSVYLTIDSDLQRMAVRAIEDAFRRGAEGWAQQSRGASVVMVDVNTGAILALASYPTFDANAFTPFPAMGIDAAQEIVEDVKADERRPLLNRGTQGAYPTGSTMKAITAIAALESGLYTPETTYTSTGIWNRDIPRYDWQAGGHGTVTMARALAVSCNTCFYEAGYRLNEQDPYLFAEYADLMGLGKTTGITDLPDEPGLIGNPDNKQSYEPTGVPWNFSDLVSIAIGQGGVQVTPLQLVQAYAAIANGGALYRPQVVDRTGLLDTFSYQMQPDLMVDTGISDQTLDTIRQGLCDVTTQPFGTAEYVFRNSRLQDEIGICAKTGTATSANGDGFPHAWFVAYAPRDNPQIAIVAMVENAGEGSGIAAPIVCRVLEYYYFDTDLSETDCV